MRVLEGGSTLGKPVAVRDLAEQPATKIDIDQAVADKILPGLVGVVCSSEGAAANSFRDFPCGDLLGKTGTAEIPSSRRGRQEAAPRSS